MNATEEKVWVGEYTNWRGETRVRKIVPHYVWWGKTAWHDEEQLLLNATDVEDGRVKNFSVSGFKQDAEFGHVPARGTIQYRPQEPSNIIHGGV